MDKRTENALTIAAKLGIEADEALRMLHKSIEVLELDDKHGAEVPARTCALLARTFDDVRLVNRASGSADLVISWGAPIDKMATNLVVTLMGATLSIAPNQRGDFSAQSIGLGQQTIAACYIAGAAISLLLPGINENTHWPLTVNLSPFAVRVDQRQGPISIDKTYIVGAGAIGNGFVWSLEKDNLAGELILLDKDRVSDGNLQRNIISGNGDIGEYKVDVLAKYLAGSQPRLKVVPKPERTETAFKDPDLRLRRLISAVDSPRARRRLQGWCPREVFDASTSGIQEVIFHHNCFPLELACLECVYPFTRDEHTHEKHVADALGVPLGALSEGIVCEQHADQIIKKYPDLQREQIVGEAYDSLFKRLCGAGKLPMADGQRVLAPLAFVSVFAGAVLAVEFQRHLATNEESYFNFWRLSPWLPPRISLRRRLPKNSECSFCNDPLQMGFMQKFWGKANR